VIEEWTNTGRWSTDTDGNKGVPVPPRPPPIPYVRPGFEPGPRCWEAASNRLSSDTVLAGLLLDDRCIKMLMMIQGVTQCLSFLWIVVVCGYVVQEEGTAWNASYVGTVFTQAVGLCFYKVVQIWPGRFVCKQVTVCPGHIWTTLYLNARQYTYNVYLRHVLETMVAVEHQ
jgi:hypothetical protein